MADSRAGRPVWLAGANSATPVTVLTGPHSAGKKDLIRHLLGDPPMAGAAVLMQDTAAGAEAHPAAILFRDTGEIQAGGCLCCAVQGDLQRALRGLLARARRGDVTRVVVATADDTDPVHVLTTIAADPALTTVYWVDRIVMIADAADTTLTERATAVRQAALADCIVIRDAGRSDPSVLRAKLRDINPAASVWDSFPPVTLLVSSSGTPANGGQGRRYAEAVEAPAVVEIRTADPLDRARTFEWVTDLMAHSDTRPIRIKGTVRFDGEPGPVTIDALRHHIAAHRRPPTGPGGQASDSHLTFVGTGLDRPALEGGLRACRVRQPAERA